MAHISHLFNLPLAIVTQQVQSWRSLCTQNVTSYYNYRIELNPEAEAQHYWNCLKQSRFAIHAVDDKSLSRFMNTLLEQGISKFAVDRFILELRRLKRCTHNS